VVHIKAAISGTDRAAIDIISTYGNSASYSEMMGYSRERLDDTYWFPWYNNISYETELRMARP
jgi:hypothetical protein